MNGKYFDGDKQIGTVEDFKPKKWFGKVTLFGLEDFAEYGTLEPNTVVITDDGKKYQDGKLVE